MGVSEVFSAPGSSESQKQMVWSIGKWGALDPTEDADMESWILCSQPTAYYNLLFIVGFHEPSHTAATDLLVQILSVSKESNSTLQATPPDFSAIMPTSDTPSPGKDEERNETP
ncbi:UPF0575 protein C19orf67 homolog [Rana temporaria]|uniref:UPF0575 protein C19orf67 homolog n=1 Tax=Rana temporaria TaxID=8407 RepID=UPI001AAC6456|nr:UPF0575 protein C19orf67 homolog [Rana temporaria]